MAIRTEAGAERRNGRATRDGVGEIGAKVEKWKGKGMGKEVEERCGVSSNEAGRKRKMGSG